MRSPTLCAASIFDSLALCRLLALTNPLARFSVVRLPPPSARKLTHWRAFLSHWREEPKNWRAITRLAFDCSLSASCDPPWFFGAVADGPGTTQRCAWAVRPFILHIKTRDGAKIRIAISTTSRTSAKCARWACAASWSIARIIVAAIPSRRPPTQTTNWRTETRSLR